MPHRPSHKDKAAFNIAPKAMVTYMPPMKFYIMNGAGNRFAVFDAREHNSFALSEEKVKMICTPGSDIMGPKGAAGLRL